MSNYFQLYIPVLAVFGFKIDGLGYDQLEFGLELELFAQTCNHTGRVIGDEPEPFGIVYKAMAFEGEYELVPHDLFGFRNVKGDQIPPSIPAVGDIEALFADLVGLEPVFAFLGNL